MGLGSVNNGAATTTASDLVISPASSGPMRRLGFQPLGRSVPSRAHGARLQSGGGYAQHYVLAVKRITAHPGAAAGIRILEVSGADLSFFFSSLASPRLRFPVCLI